MQNYKETKEEKEYKNKLAEIIHSPEQYEGLKNTYYAVKSFMKSKEKMDIILKFVHPDKLKSLVLDEIHLITLFIILKNIQWSHSKYDVLKSRTVRLNSYNPIVFEVTHGIKTIELSNRYNLVGGLYAYLYLKERSKPLSSMPLVDEKKSASEASASVSNTNKPEQLSLLNKNNNNDAVFSEKKPTKWYLMEEMAKMFELSTSGLRNYVCSHIKELNPEKIHIVKVKGCRKIYDQTIVDRLKIIRNNKRVEGAKLREFTYQKKYGQKNNTMAAFFESINSKLDLILEAIKSNNNAQVTETIKATASINNNIKEEGKKHGLLFKPKSVSQIKEAFINSSRHKSPYNTYQPSNSFNKKRLKAVD